MSEIVKRTRAEIETLKANWQSDPCWDIEQTEGFEAHYKELRAFRRVREEGWRKAEEDRMMHFASRYGIPNLKLASYLDYLEKRIAQLEAQIERLQNGE